MNTTIKKNFGLCMDCTDNTERPLVSKRCQYHYWQYRAEQKKWKSEKRDEIKSFLRKPISPISKKRTEDLKKYRKVRDEFMKHHPTCQAKLPGCTAKATDVHHKKSRIGDLLTDTKFFMAVCRYCHNKIEDGGEWVYELGFKVKRI